MAEDARHRCGRPGTSPPAHGGRGEALGGQQGQSCCPGCSEELRQHDRYVGRVAWGRSQGASNGFGLGGRHFGLNGCQFGLKELIWAQSATIWAQSTTIRAICAVCAPKCEVLLCWEPRCDTHPPCPPPEPPVSPSPARRATATAARRAPTARCSTETPARRRRWPRSCPGASPAAS